MYQFTSCFLCECVNLVFLTRQGSLIDLIMNYVAFEGISALDNLYVESIRNMEILEQYDGATEEAKQELLSFMQESSKTKEEKVHWNKLTITKVEKDDDGVEKEVTEELGGLSYRLLIIVFHLVRYIYKGLYFYMLPYMIVPLSYIVYNPMAIQK